ncbi:MAG: MFS transporter [Dehalococcoidia bacterium]|nr:MFS transporter [Dehalococcoidia bacterium]
MNSEPDPIMNPKTATGRFQYKWILLLVVSGGGFLSIMNAGMVNIGAPGMMEDFQTSASLIVWVNLAFVMGATVPLLPLSRISDSFGRKRLYLSGALIVTAGLALSAISQDLAQLIMARVVTAIGSSMILANDNALLTQAFPASERGKAQGMINMAFGLGIGLSFFLGGILIDTFDWRALFWARIPAQLLLAFAVWQFVRDDSKDTSEGRSGYSVDYAGVTLLAVVMVGSLLAINQAGSLGLLSPFVAAAIGTTALALPVLIILERRANFPVIQLTLFKSRVFSSGVTAQFFAQMAHGGWNFLAPFLLITGMGYSASIAGLILLPFHTIRLVLSPISGVLSDRFGTRLTSLVGHLTLLCGLIVLTTLETDASIWLYLVVITIGGAGLSIFLPANNSAIMGFVPQDSLSSASGFLATSRSMGNAMGMALAAAVYSRALGSGGLGEVITASTEAVNAVSQGITVVTTVSAIGLVAIILRGRG